MPIIKKPTVAHEKKQIRVRINESLLNEIESYCKWADLPSLDYFFEQVAMLSLKKDKDWKSVKAESIPSTKEASLSN